MTVVQLAADTAEDLRALGGRLAGLLRAGDLVLLAGALGAGKTTLTQGIGAGLRVRGVVTSPTFVIARVHPSTVGGPPLVHVDAYRLAGWDELEDLDLEAALEDAVTVVEWGTGLAEGLADDRLEVTLERDVAAAAGGTESGPDGPRGAGGHGGDTADGADAPDPRRVVLRGIGRRWDGVDLTTLAALPPRE